MTTVGKMAGKDVADMQHHLAETSADHVPEQHHRMAEKERNQTLFFFPFIKSNCFLMYAYILEKVETLHSFIDCV
jgi:hypothetical protein